MRSTVTGRRTTPASPDTPAPDPRRPAPGGTTRCRTASRRRASPPPSTRRRCARSPRAGTSDRSRNRRSPGFHKVAEDPALEQFGVAIGPCEHQRRDEMRPPVLRIAGVELGEDARHRARKVLVRPRPAGGEDARRPVEGIDAEARIVGEGRQARAFAAACALIAAFSENIVPVSSGSGRPSSPAETASMPKGARRSRISASLPLLWVAMTTLPVRRRLTRWRPSAGRRDARCRAGRAGAVRAAAPRRRGPSRPCPAPRRCRPCR